MRATPLAQTVKIVLSLLVVQVEDDSEAHIDERKARLIAAIGST